MSRSHERKTIRGASLGPETMDEEAVRHKDGPIADRPDPEGTPANLPHKCLLDPYNIYLSWEVVSAAGKMRSIEFFVNFTIMDIT
jgi:hypothetical protein